MVVFKDWIVSNINQMDKEIEIVMSNTGELYGLKFKQSMDNIIPITSVGNISEYPKPCPVQQCNGGNYLKKNGYPGPCFRCNSTGFITYEQAQKNSQKGYSNVVT